MQRLSIFGLLAALILSASVAVPAMAIRTFGYIPAQVEAEKALAKTQELLFISGVTLGKSYFGASQIYKHCVNERYRRAWFVGPKFQLMESNWFMPLKLWGQVDGTLKKAQGIYHYLIYKNYSWAAMQSAKLPRELRAAHLDLAFIEEASILPEMTLHMTRHRLSARGGKLAMLTNPPEPGDPGFEWVHRLYREFRERPDEEAMVVQFPSWANPLEYPGGEEDPKILAAKKKQPPHIFARMYGGDMSIREGLVYPSFDRDKHVISGPYEPKGTIYIFGDYGMNTACILWADYDGEHLTIFKEFYRPGITSPRVTEHYVAGTEALGIAPQKVRDCYIDPANADLKAQVSAKGFNVERYGTVDKRNKVQLVDRVERWLYQNASDGKPKFRVSSKCEHTIWELENLITGRDGTVPADGQPNHATDSIQYGLCGVEWAKERRRGPVIRSAAIVRGGR